MNKPVERRERPLSPHLQVYKWPLTMATSISHRASGIFNLAGVYVFIGWLLSLMCTEQCYLWYSDLLFRSVIGRLFLLAWVAALSYHLINGIRHLIWDTATGLEKAEAFRSSVMVILGAIAVFVVILNAALGE